MLDGLASKVEDQQEAAPSAACAPLSAISPPHHLITFQSELSANPLQAAREVEDLEDVLGELVDKVEELQGAVREKAATKRELRAAFSQIATAFTAAPAGSGGAGGRSAGGPSGAADADEGAGAVAGERHSASM